MIFKGPYNEMVTASWSFVRATSHMRVRAHDPLHFKHSHWWEKAELVQVQMNHVSWSLGLFSKTPLGGRPNTKPGDHGTLNAHNR